MADNVTISSGSGTGIATDQVATTNEHVQLFKLAYSEDGSRVLVPATGDGLTVKIQARVSDTADSLSPDTVAPLSLSSDGRLRVVTVSESNNFTAWGDPTDWGSCGLDVDSYPLTVW